MLTVIQQKKQYRDPQNTYEEVYKRANFTPNTNGNDSRLPKQHLTNPDSIQRFLFIDNPRTRYLVIGGTKSFALPRTTTHQALGTTTTIRIFSLIHTRLGICRILYTHCYFSSFLLLPRIIRSAQDYGEYLVNQTQKARNECIPKEKKTMQEASLIISYPRREE